MDETDDRHDPPPDATLSRRDWLLDFGSAVVLSGFSGPRDSLRSWYAKSASLPPGLYQPSFDHLNHAIESEGPFYPIPPGAETEYVRARSSPFRPQAFSAEEFRLVGRLVEVILGEDLKHPAEPGPPGAGAGICEEVAEWIDLVVACAPGTRAAARSLTPEQRALAVAYFGSEEPVVKLETFEPERACREGILWLNEESHRRFARNFLDAGATDQSELVASISDARPDATVHAGTRLYDFLKAESARGFYTSRAGLKELDYAGNRFYGQSPGCGVPEGRKAESRKPES
jgi:Gluconate 2-dehydrogenase subunit 3